MHYFPRFFKKVNKLFVTFLRLWTKNANCWEILKILEENSIEKIDFSIISGKIVAKYRALGNNTRFLQQFFRFRRGVAFPCSFQAPMSLVLVRQMQYNLQLDKCDIGNSYTGKFDSYYFRCFSRRGNLFNQLPKGCPPKSKNCCRKLVLFSESIYFRRRGKNPRNI